MSAVFAFDEAKMRECLNQWGKAQQARNPTLMDTHIDYMKGSVLLFLMSAEAEPLRMKLQTGDPPDAPEQDRDSGLSQDSESDN